MALLSFRGISTPSLPAQGEQRRSSYFNIPRGNSTDSTTMLKAQSYADLLNPIPNAAATLKAVDEAGDTSEVRVAENGITTTIITAIAGSAKS
jgi:hypothetical protein